MYNLPKLNPTVQVKLSIVRIFAALLLPLTLLLLAVLSLAAAVGVDLLHHALERRDRRGRRDVHSTI